MPLSAHGSSTETLLLAFNLGPVDDSGIGRLTAGAWPRNLDHLLDTAWESGSFKWAEKYARAKVWKSLEESGEGGETTMTSIEKLASVLGQRGLSEEALKLSEHAISLRTRVQGRDHPDTLGALANHSASLLATGRTQEALDLAIAVTRDCRAKLGNEDYRTLRAISNLSSAYQQLGDYEAAIPLLRELVEMRSRVLPDGHSELMLSMTNLAVAITTSSGPSEEAARLLGTVFEKRRGTYGESHPRTLRSAQNAECAYKELESWKKLIPIQTWIVDHTQKTLGVNHEKTMLAWMNLQASYLQEENWHEGAICAKHVYSIETERHGGRHSNTVDAFRRLCMSFSKSGSLSAWAKVLLLRNRYLEQSKIWDEEYAQTSVDLHALLRDLGYRQYAFHLVQKIMSQEDPSKRQNLATVALVRIAGSYADSDQFEVAVSVVKDTLSGMSQVSDRVLNALGHLGNALWKKLQQDEAEFVYLKALSFASRQGPLGEHVIVAESNLLSLYRKQERWDEAEEIALRLYSKLSESYGDNDEKTALALANLQGVYLGSRRWEKFAESGEAVVTLCKKVMGESHERTLDAMANQASYYREVKLYPEAVKLQREVLRIRISVQGKDRVATATSRLNLGINLDSMSRYDEAVVELRAAAEGFMKELGMSHPDTLLAFRHLSNISEKIQSSGTEDDLVMAASRQLMLEDDSWFSRIHPDYAGAVVL